MENENDKVIDTEKELNYQKTVNLMKCIKCMTVCKDKVEMYQKVAKQFSAFSGYKDSNECAELCKQLSKQMNKDIKRIIYKRAQDNKINAKLATDYKVAADGFREASGYKDADDMASVCDLLSLRIEKKATRKRVIKFGVVALCIVVIMVGATTSHAKYYLANAYKITGSYNSAIKVYKKLGAYKDSKESLIECQYLNGLDLESEGDFKSAEKAFSTAGFYKDSEVRKVEMEKLILINSKVGKTVTIGNYDWEILDYQKNQALLMMKSALPGKAYHDKSEAVTWENSTLRKWLNTDFLKETFSMTEQKNIMLSNIENSDNAVYGTDGGNDTQDYIFLLSMKEVEKYNSLFPTFKSNSWLRSPGYSGNSAAFLSMNGSVMDYGYLITDEEIKVRPALWFNIDSIENQ